MQPQLFSFSDAVLEWPFAAPWAGCHLARLEFTQRTAAPEVLAELNQPASYANAKRQSEFYAGRLCAMQALRQLDAAAPAPERCAETRAPLWPAAMVGSISHSHGLAMAVAAYQSDWLGLGLDVERMLTPQRSERLWTAILTADEQDKFGKDDWAQHELLTLVFSAKESLFKLLHPLTGCYFGFQDAQLVQLGRDGCFTLELLKQLSGEFPAHSLIYGQWARVGHGMATLSGWRG